MVNADRADERGGSSASRRLSGTAGLILALLCLTAHSGCKAYYLDAQDWVMDRFDYRDPVAVLKEKPDARERAKFLRRLQEPKETGGKQEQQDEVIEMLTKIAIRDHEPLCRLEAIRTLGHFKDPRAADILEEAFYKAEKAFPNEVVENAIQQQALTSIAETGQPKGRDLLILVARNRVKRSELQSQHQHTDLRLAAIRGLGEYREMADVTETLLHLMKTEKDVAIRDGAHDTLVTVTGRQLPPDAQKWDDFLHHADQRDANQKPGLLQLTSWWK